jgi:hypothetical protein
MVCADALKAPRNWQALHNGIAVILLRISAHRARHE